MKRNWDIIREILLTAERKTLDEELELSDFDENQSDEIIYNMTLLINAKLIEASITPHSGGFIIDMIMITWSGHDFLDSVRNETVWEKTKSKITGNGGTMIFELVKSVAIKLVTELVS